MTSALGRGLAAALFALLLTATASADGGNEQAWQEAIAARDTAALSRLLAEETDPQPAGGDGVTALMVAAAAGDRSLVARLLASGAAVDRRNDKGASALLYAAHRGHAPVVAALLAAGAAVDVAASNGWTSLTLAAATGRAETVRLLLAHGANPNHPDIYGWTPLMRAVDNGYPEAARRLLADPRTDVSRRDEAGMTALHHAARRHDQALARALVRHCAEPTATDLSGRTPVDILRARWGDTGEWLRAAARRPKCRGGIARAPR